MTLHSPTIVVMSITTGLLLVLILLHTWRTHTTYPGFLHWIIGTACWTVGSYLNMLLADIQPAFIPRIIGAGLILMHPILTYEGLLRFYGLRRGLFQTPFNSFLTVAYLVVALYWTYVADNFILRSASFALVFAFLYGRIVFEPLMTRDIRRDYPIQWLISLSLLPLVLLMLLRALWLLVNGTDAGQMSSALVSDSVLRWVLIYSFIVEVIPCYCYLALTSDRVERELQEARRTAEEANRAQSIFLKTISHELRTPLAAIAGATELLSRRIDKKDDVLQMLQQGVAGQQRLISDLLDSVRLKTGTLRVEPAPFNLAAMLDELRTVNLPRMNDKGVTFTDEYDGRLPELISGDRQRITQILANLLENALKFTPANGTVLMRTELLPGPNRTSLRFTISDTGIGIPQEQQEEIFRSFVSLNPEKGGMGLGLSISRQLAASMHGQLTCTSTLGKGSSFSLTIPCELPPPDWAATSSPAAMTSQLQQPLDILSVDDTPENQKMLELLLKGTPARLTFAPSAQHALALLEQQPFDLLLTDIRMPDMNGHTLVQTIRNTEQQQGRQPMRIVALSANGAPEDIQAALNAGCNSYLPRPFTLGALLRELSPIAQDNCAQTAPQAGFKQQFRHLQQQARERLTTLAGVIEVALGQKDYAAIREEAHRVKGLGMTFGLDGVERIGTLLEQADRKVKPEAILTLLEELKQQI